MHHIWSLHNSENITDLNTLTPVQNGRCFADFVFKYICMLNELNPDSKVHGANMGPTWVLPAPDGPHVGPMNLAIREVLTNRI